MSSRPSSVSLTASVSSDTSSPSATTSSGFFRQPQIEDVDITSTLQYRITRANDHSAENRALVTLAQELVTSPQNVLQKLAQFALQLCDAHSAGISISEEADNKRIFRWHAVAGRWARFLGGTMPRGISPCGTVLDRNASLLLNAPHRFYPIPAELTPPIVEVLLIPFHVGGCPVGTVWIVSHDDTLKFDSEDERVMKNLGKFASSAYQILASLEAVTLSEVRYRALVHATTDSVWRMSGDGESMLELKSEVALPHAATAGPTREWLRTYMPEDERARVSAKWARAIASRSPYEVEHRAIAASGEIRTWISRATPLLDGRGDVREWIGASTDITDRKRAEDELQRTLQDLEAKVTRRTQQLAEKNQLLEKEIAERRKAESARSEALKRLVDTEELQRRAISRELHDQVGQQLAALSMGLCGLSSSENAMWQSKASQLQADIERLGKTVHDLALELRPSALDDAGLLAALTSYLEEWSKRTGVASALHQSGPVGRLPDAIETTLYRLVQEALTNVAKHAGARRVSVVVERRADVIRLIIEDDGQGFDVGRALNPHASKRLGVLGMRERVALCCGELLIESGPDQGTAIYCNIPVE